MAHEIQGDVEVPIQLTKDQIHFCLGLIATNKNLAIACIHFAYYRENPLRPLLTNTDIAAFHAEISALDTEDDSQKAAWGTGGPGYTIQDEYDQSLGFESDGVVAMANTGAPNSGGSQFFITYSPYTFGNGKYPIFGKLKSGMDILKSLQIGDQIISVTYK